MKQLLFGLIFMLTSSLYAVSAIAADCTIQFKGFKVDGWQGYSLNIWAFIIPPTSGRVAFLAGYTLYSGSPTKGKNVPKTFTIDCPSEANAKIYLAIDFGTTRRLAGAKFQICSAPASFANNVVTFTLRGDNEEFVLPGKC